MSIVNRLDNWANIKSSAPAFIFLNKDGEEKEVISFRSLQQKALRIAGAIRKESQEQERVVLFFSPGIEFIVAFLGCLYARTIAIPIPPPQSKRQLSRVIPVMDDANPNLILTMKGMGEGFDLPKLYFEDALTHDPFEERSSKDQIAFLQYTSGSTSRPKGVILTHAHLLYHQKILQEAFQHTEETKVVGWLPFYHDMGLIGNILQPLYLGGSCTLMAPLTFMQRPFLWIEAISRYKATTSGGPNFAYQLCCSKITDQELSKLDLSSWTIAFNGAERVLSETMRTFARKFAPCGFREESFFPCYGMAETALFITGRKGVCSTLFTTPEGQLSDVVNCGSTVLNETVVIVDPETKQICPEKNYGEIWVSGKSVAAGYWNQPDATESTFNAFTSDGKGPFLRTGDLGFLENRELFVLGRLKNMVILRGKNYFPHDLEMAITKAHPALAGSQGAAFSIDVKDGEELVIVQEISRHIKDPLVIEELFQNIKSALAVEFEIAPHAIVFVVLNSLPRTTSGKIQHFQTRQHFQEKTLPTLFSWEKTEIFHFNEDPNLNRIVHKLSQLLGINSDKISLDDPIIKLGLDSLSGVQFLTWIQEEYGKELDLPYLLSGATLNQIKEIVQSVPFAEAKKTDHNIAYSESPLSWNQENIWVSCQLQSSSSGYNISFAVRLKGLLNGEALKEAIGDLMKRHATLRTYFVSRNSGPIQIVSDQAPIPLDICKGSIESFCSHQFDLTKAPLFKIFLLNTEEESVLIFHFHHLIFDGWSVEILFRELEEAYQCRTEGTKVSWIPLSSQYNAFVRWQQELFQSPVYKTVEKNWEKRLASEEYPVLKISPFNPPPIKEHSYSKSRLMHSNLVQKIKEFAVNQEVTLPIVLMAAFHAILHLYSGEKRIYVGFPSANRPQTNFQKMIGFFVNTLVCKTESTQNGTFLDLLRQVKECVWTDAKETAYSFQHLLQLLRPPRFVNASPIFQAMFVMQNAPTTRAQFGNLKMELLPIQSSPPLYDLVLEVQQTKEGLKLLFEYQHDKISGAFVEELSRVYLAFLEQAIEYPTASLESYNLSTEEITIIDLFEKQAEANPDKTAIFSDKGNLTYKELKQAVFKIASSLIDAGIKPSEPVGLCLEREPFLIASVLAILKAGGAYVPIDPTYPAARCQTIVNDAKIRFILASEKGAQALSFFRGTLFNPSVESRRSIISSEFPRLSDGLAYILYTSGSTGNPKGVMVGHQSLLNFSLAAIDFFHMSPDDKVLQFSSICWDTSSEEIYPALLSGASLVLRGEGRVESFESLLARTEKYRISFWDLPSSYWHDLVDLLERKKIPIPPSLRLVIVGGEKVNRSKVCVWCEKVAPRVQLLNTYGATEATSISAIFDLSKWSSEWEDIPIGRPIRNVRLYVLNSLLKPVPPGMPGDLYIGGAGLSRGYLNLEELTSQKFIRHPETHETIYRTGDVALTTLCGEVLLRGRSDRQIKRRGFRIEVEEIERILSDFKGVAAALVVLKGTLVAYVVFSKTTLPPPLSSLKEFLKIKLPDYMIPDHIYFLTEIPRLHNGKIDMLSIDSYRIEIQEMMVEGTYTQTEEGVLTVWKEILGLESIGKEESFFDVGGNSLLVIRLHERLQEVFSMQLNISSLFSYYTIASQAQKIELSQEGSKNRSKLDLLRQLENGAIDSSEALQALKNL